MSLQICKRQKEDSQDTKQDTVEVSSAVQTHTKLEHQKTKGSQALIPDK